MLRYPADPDAVEALEAIPHSELIDLLAGQIASLAGGKAGPGKADTCKIDPGKRTPAKPIRAMRVESTRSV